MPEGTKYPSNFPEFKKQSPFAAETMTKKDHDAAELHFIGDALPVPSVAPKISTVASAGTSPIPAREDHVHYLSQDLGVSYIGTPTIPNGTTTVINLTADMGLQFGFMNDWRTGSVINVPDKGVWQIFFGFFEEGTWPINARIRGVIRRNGLAIAQQFVGDLTAQASSGNMFGMGGFVGATLAIQNPGADSISFVLYHSSGASRDIKCNVWLSYLCRPPFI